MTDKLVFLAEEKKRLRPSPFIVGVGDYGSNNFRAIIDKEGVVIDQVKMPCRIVDALTASSDTQFYSIVKGGVIAIDKIVAMYKRYGVAPHHTRQYATEAFRDLASDASPRSQRALEMFRGAAAEYGYMIIPSEKEIALLKKTARAELVESPSPEAAALMMRHDDVTVAHWGGGSLDLLFFRAGCEATLPLGVHKLDNIRCAVGLGQANDALLAGLAENWPQGRQNCLALEGGQCRSFAALLCKDGSPILTRQKAMDGLASLATKGENYFKKRGGQVKKRAPYMAAAASQLMVLIDYVDAREIIFLHGKMVASIASELREDIAASRSLNSAPPVGERGIVQLFVPSTP